MDGFPSGQRGQTVNLLQIASVVRIHLHPLCVDDDADAAVAELADAQDLKSCGGDIVPVRFRSAARIFNGNKVRNVGFGLYFFDYIFDRVRYNLPDNFFNMPIIKLKDKLRVYKPKIQRDCVKEGDLKWKWGLYFTLIIR